MTFTVTFWVIDRETSVGVDGARIEISLFEVHDEAHVLIESHTGYTDYQGLWVVEIENAGLYATVVSAVGYETWDANKHVGPNPPFNRPGVSLKPIPDVHKLTVTTRDEYNVPLGGVKVEIYEDVHRVRSGTTNSLGKWQCELTPDLDYSAVATKSGYRKVVHEFYMPSGDHSLSLTLVIGVDPVPIPTPIVDDLLGRPTEWLPEWSFWDYALVVGGFAAYLFLKDEL